MSPIPHSANFELAASFQKAKTSIYEFAVLDEGGSVLCLLHPNDFNLTRDRTRSVRADGDWTCAGNLRSLVPPGIDPRVLLPFGTEVRISRGYEYTNGTQELLNRATLRLIATNLGVALESGTGTHFRGEDRAERLDREGLVPFDASPGEFYDDVIVRYLEQAWRGVNPDASLPPFQVTRPIDPVTGEPFLTPLLHAEAKTKAWTETMDWATACGQELFISYGAAITMAPLPDRCATAPVWQFVDGVNDTRISLARNYASDSTPNYWTVNATGPGMPTGPEGYVGTAFVDDPSISISVSGQYGTVPVWKDSVLATSSEMCAAEAEAEKAKVLSGTDTIEIETNAIGFLLEGDVVNVTSEQLEIADETYVIASIAETMHSMKITAGRG